MPGFMFGVYSWRAITALACTIMMSLGQMVELRLSAPLTELCYHQDVIGQTLVLCVERQKGIFFFFSKYSSSLKLFTLSLLLTFPDIAWMSCVWIS